MPRFLPALLLACSLFAALAAAADDKKVHYIDLKPKANQKLNENFHVEMTLANNLADLPKGEQTFGGIKFKVADRMIQLGSSNVQDKPIKVDGIKVDRPVARLHILHATGFSTEDDTEIGSYTVHYEDKTQEKIPIVYGKDVRDWWYQEGGLDVSRGKAVWKGETEYSKSLKSKVRLYLSTWKNPHPDKKIVSIDYTSTEDLPTAPFCVAISADEK